MLIKLIVVNSNHFIKQKCKIMHCLDSQTLSELILTIVLDDNEKLSINEMLEVLIGVGTFTSTSSFDMQRLQFVTMNQLQKSMPRGLQLFPFYLVVPYIHTVSGFCWKLKLLHTMRCLYEDGANVSICSGVAFYVELTHNLHISLINNISLNNSSVDFIHFIQNCS